MKANSVVELYFPHRLPRGECHVRMWSSCEDVALKTIRDSSSVINLSMYCLTSSSIIYALAAASDRGVDLSVVLDSSQYAKQKANLSAFADKVTHVWLWLFKSG